MISWLYSFRIERNDILFSTPLNQPPRMSSSSIIFNQAPPQGKLAIIQFISEQKIPVKLSLTEDGMRHMEHLLRYDFLIEQLQKGMHVQITSVNIHDQLIAPTLLVLQKSNDSQKECVYVPFDTPIMPEGITIPILDIVEISPLLNFRDVPITGTLSSL